MRRKDHLCLQIKSVESVLSAPELRDEFMANMRGLEQKGLSVERILGKDNPFFTYFKLASTGRLPSYAKGNLDYLAHYDTALAQQQNGGANGINYAALSAV